MTGSRREEEVGTSQGVIVWESTHGWCKSEPEEFEWKQNEASEQMEEVPNGSEQQLVERQFAFRRLIRKGRTF